MLEVGLALVLAVLSVGFIAGAILLALFLFGPFGSEDSGGRVLILAGVAFAVYILKYPWIALLKYYRYEAHTLRPIKDEKTAARPDGREKNEG